LRPVSQDLCAEYEYSDWIQGREKYIPGGKALTDGFYLLHELGKILKTTLKSEGKGHI
jgi:hypothetical protein